MSDRFVSWGTPVTAHERELLTILIEECSEVQQCATKAMRFGLDEIQPEQPHTNVQRLAHEIGDLVEVIARLTSIGVLAQSEIDAGRAHKVKQLAKYMQTEPTDGE